MAGIALITGGGSGIGKAAAQSLAGAGWTVVITGRRLEVLQATAAGIAAKGGSAHAFAADVTDEAQVEALFARIKSDFGRLDLLFNNAGGSSTPTPIEDVSLAAWKSVIDLNLTGSFLCLRAAFRLMKAQGAGGSMIFIASKNGMVASNQAVAYCAAKAAEIQLSRSFALEGAPLGIRCNVVNPDAVIRGSKIWTGTWSQERAAANKVDEQDLEAFYRDRSMLKRSVFPEDIAEATYFFAAEHLSAKSTGNILNVDAGNLAAFTR